jgi:hypothetical protein
VDPDEQDQDQYTPPPDYGQQAPQQADGSGAAAPGGGGPRPWQTGTAPDGTEVIYVPQLGRAVALNKLKSMGITAPQQGSYNPAAIGKDDTPVMTSMLEARDVARTLATRAQAFMKGTNASPDLATGPIYGDVPLLNHVIPNAMKAVRFGIDKATGDNQAVTMNNLDTINGATWALLKQKGAGAIRGFESEGSTGWKNAFPSTANYMPTNQAIAARLQQEADEADRHVAFVQNFVHSGQGGLGQAELAYRAAGGTQTPLTQGFGNVFQKSLTANPLAVPGGGGAGAPAAPQAPTPQQGAGAPARYVPPTVNPRAQVNAALQQRSAQARARPVGVAPPPGAPRATASMRRPMYDLMGRIVGYTQ